MKLRLALEAERNLADIGDWIARDDLAASRRMVIKLRTACENIAETPTLYRFADDAETVRRFLVRPYIIYYHLLNEVIEVLAIYHGARDQSRWG